MEKLELFTEDTSCGGSPTGEFRFGQPRNLNRRDSAQRSSLVSVDLTSDETSATGGRQNATSIVATPRSGARSFRLTSPLTRLPTLSVVRGSPKNRLIDKVLSRNTPAGLLAVYGREQEYYTMITEKKEPSPFLTEKKEPSPFLMSCKGAGNVVQYTEREWI